MHSSKTQKSGKSKYVADFETTTDENDCRVWAWALCNIYDVREIYYGNTIQSFCEYVSRLHADVYFHNLAFDGSFIVDYLFNNGFVHSTGGALKPNQFSTLISAMGKWYNIVIKWSNGVRTEILDSLKKLPMSVVNIAKSFKLEESKLKIDYDEYRAPGHILTEHEIAYITADVVIVAKALRVQFDQGMVKMTVGADSLAEFRDVLGSSKFTSLFPILPDSMDADIRAAYRGGFTYCDPRFARRVIGPGRTYDVNSLYPSVMYSKPVPYGEPVYFRAKPFVSEMYPLYVINITFTAKLKPNHIPCIQVKGHSIFSPTEYLTNIVEPTTLSCTNIDLALWQDHYDMDILSYNGGWQFKSISGVFNDFIDKWILIKEHSDGGVRMLAKLQLNSLYGKFATNPDVTSKIPIIKDGVVRLIKGEPETRNPVYTPVGVFITAYARDVTIRAAQQHYGVFAYADTDSLHLLVEDDPGTLDVNPSRMGAWKREMVWSGGLFVRAKCYTELPMDTRTCATVCPIKVAHVTHVAGLPDVIADRMTFASFVDGAVFDGKLLPERVPGGIVLKDVGFTLNM